MGIIIAIIVFSIIVLFHEFGHFIFAKLNGVGVTEFALGMGPIIGSFKRGETVYAVKLLPLGGSCSMVGEDSDETGEKSFNSKNVFQRFSIIFAGPAFNFILALIFSFILVCNIGYDSPIVYEVPENGPAWNAGIRKGDLITAVDGHSVKMYKEFRMYTLMNKNGEPLNITLNRHGETYSTVVTPSLDPDGYYRVHIYGGTYVKTGIVDSVKYSFYEVRYWITTTIKSLRQLVSGQVSRKEVSGPVGIVTMIDNTYEESSEYGMKTVLLSMVNIGILLSANLGVLNLLPLPALDGGRIFFLIIEMIRRKRIPPEKEGWIHAIGFLCLMALMVVIFFNDIQKIVQ